MMSIFSIPTSFRNASVLPTTNSPVVFLGIAVASVIRLSRTRATSMGAVCPASPSSPMKAKSKWTSGSTPSLAATKWGASFPRPFTQWMHQERYGR